MQVIDLLSVEGISFTYLSVAGADTVRWQTNTRKYPDSLVTFIDCGGHSIPSYSSFAQP
jgi:hypothetical protein